MIRRLFILLLTAFAASCLAACSSPEKDDPNNVSKTPWDRPEKWENGSQMPGGMMGTP